MKVGNNPKSLAAKAAHNALSACQTISLSDYSACQAYQLVKLSIC